MAFGKRVRYYRTKREWTLEDLADRSGVDVGTIGALEIRDSARSKFTGALAKAFGLTIEQLLDETRDWLEPTTPSNVHEVRARAGRYVVTRWLFSDELFEALKQKKKRDLHHIENIVRAHLQMPALAAKPAKRDAA